MSFIDIFDNKTAEVKTENGARAWSTTNSKVLDFFAAIGGMRERDEEDIIELYRAARDEDKELADKVILWVGSIRNGQGERRIRRILLKELANIDPNKVNRNLQTFVDAGRWDDLFVLFDTPCEDEMITFIKKQLASDIENLKNDKSISLLNKWLPSSNTSSKKTRALARRIRTRLGLPEKEYRKMLSILRKYSNVVEVKMSSQKWDDIDFETVPSRAMLRYSSAFSNHSFKRFDEYMTKVKEGKAKINSFALYPYDVVRNLGSRKDDNSVPEAQWKSLPNYFKEGRNIIVMADVSGSMMGGNPAPIDVSISLAIYCAQRNIGAYHGYCMTFTDQPHFFKIEDDEPLLSSYCKLMAQCGFNTNLDGALEEIFKMAKESGEVPEALFVISDGEIDDFLSEGTCDSIVDKYVKKFSSINLECPKIVFWNVEARGNRYLDRMTNPYVSFVSGASSSTFKNMNDLIDLGPYESMVKILSQYEFV